MERLIVKELKELINRSIVSVTEIGKDSSQITIQTPLVSFSITNQYNRYYTLKYYTFEMWGNKRIRKEDVRFPKLSNDAAHELTDLAMVRYQEYFQNSQPGQVALYDALLKINQRTR